jgi:hypothetical protein
MGVVWRKPTMKENEQSPLKMERKWKMKEDKMKEENERGQD